MTSITKADFVTDLAKSHQITQQQAREAVNDVVSTLTQTLIKGHGITLPGLGTFSLKKTDGSHRTEPSYRRKYLNPGETQRPLQSGERSPPADPTARMIL